MSKDAGIENPDVVDLVTQDPGSGEVALIMTETRPWGSSSRQLLELQAKINTYLAFALDGQMAREYPTAVGKALRLQLDCVAAPEGDVAHFIRLVEEKLRAQGIRFVVNLI